MTAALVAAFCRSFSAPQPTITLGIHDTRDPVHGHKRLLLFRARNGARRFLVIRF